uniref:Laminin subunit alpha 3 n=1 Tax=Lates calcarifer TaxID=8187 RepID=A0A4W6DE38_LATCA
MAREMRGAHLLAVFFTLWITLFRDAKGQETFNDLTGFSLSPPYFNLAEGSRISATATCGQDEAGTPRYELYCKLVGGPTNGLPTQNIQGQFCDYCNSADPNKAHPVSNAIDGTERWWQSPPLSRGLGYNEVNVTLDLGQLFHVAYVLIKFANSPRPDLWVLERSVDNGRTFTPWQYFAHSKRECIERFGKQPNGRTLSDDDQLCTTEYSRIVPLENGEIVVSLVNGRPGSKNFTYSPVLRDFTKATNIRLRFLRTSTLLGHLISKAQRDPTVTRRYYYSIKDISIGGRCVCHGHAQVCGGGRNPDNPNRLQCECQHNTCGESCDRCCPGFNQKPWRAATVDSPNECQPCQCFFHAFDCYYDPEVEKRGASLDTFGRYDGGGVCINCQHNTAGVNCERCIEGFYRPYGVPPESPSGCIPCRCDERTTAGCEMGSGRCICKPQFAGENCDRCADGYYYYPQCFREFCCKPTPCPLGHFGSPICQRCTCDYRGTVYEVCDASGRCLCRQGVEGERCDRCQPRYHSFPNCEACRCDGAGVVDSSCSPSGRCVCLPNYGGQECDECAPGYYGYPDCAVCRCSPEGSHGNVCNPLSGQCLCLPGVVGQQCDRCASGLRFPQCSGTELANPQTGSCHCLSNVEGTLCNRCKPLYWNLATDNPHGCIECRCDLKGTLSGVGECEQKSGQCHCKPNACGHSCDSCKDGYFMLQKKNYFGCRGCQCDVGGAIDLTCDEISGQCRCRKNIVGRKCREPAPNHYFPTLHQLKFEVEDGTTPNSRPVRFGYNPREFPDFSWRGYAVMSPAQPEVILTLTLGFPGPFHIVIRYVTPKQKGRKRARARILVVDEAGSQSYQSKEVIFPESRSPSFLTVPGEGFAEPFALTPGKWIIHIRAEGVLLDYLVLLPRDYYEAPLLQEKITQPCTYLPAAHRNTNCLLYKHVALDGFSSVLGSQGILSSRSERRRRQARVRRPTPDHPEMAALNGRQSQLQLSLRVPHSGPYTLVLEYASEVDNVQNVNIVISGQLDGQIPCLVTPCSFLCRSVAVDSSNQVAVLQLSHKTELLLQTSTTSFLLYKVYAVPAEEFSIEYVDPKVLCVSTHGRFTEDSRHCVMRQFDKPSSAWILYAARDGQLSSAPAVALQLSPCLVDTYVSFFFQTEISFTPRVPLPGRYVVVVHYHQPEHTSFPVEVRVDAGRDWRGSINASFCPAVSGCREVVIADGRIALDLDQNSWRQPSISVIVPPRKTLILDYILLVPDSSYTPDLLKEKPLDNSADFIQQCRGEGFYVDPRTSSEFCRDSARSLVAAYNDGALACNCDKSGSTGPTCDPVGGQCPCRQHIIGRQCTKCATGYYGFPYCRPCECGSRLCDEVTGRCICPPQTVKPACDVCQNQTFNYHPLLGCEGCNCSPDGIKPGAGPECERITGQCSCKPRIGGRQCDRCAAGYYRFPDCVPCNCNQGGVTRDVCHPDTGRCLCKRNVAGVRCDTCREGSFYFDPSNPQGCTSCFCFGATDQCQSSSKRRGKFVDMRGWRLERPDQEQVPSVLNTASNTVVADIQELPPTVQSLHWVAPQSYLGDRVICCLQGNWRHAITNRPVSREELMMVLAGLEGLRIRALYFTQSQRLSLGEVGLEEATNTGTGGPANTVEHCSCPPQYTGESCEKCAPGFYRDGSGPYLGRCVPCECNGLADECEDKTGRCLNCQYNTAGDRCERCKEGYYGNAAQRTCRVCPCPFSVPTNSFAVGCKEVFGDFQCICRTGYTGERCERCAPGYYGDPLTSGGSCKPCNCNGNGNNCDSRTGAQMDGAKTDLTKKVNEIAKAAAQEDIVVAAEEHVYCVNNKNTSVSMYSATNPCFSLTGAAAELADLKKRLKDADKKKKTLNKDLLDAQNQLNDIKRDDISDMIDEAKKKAALANDTASNTMDKLNDIRKELDKINVSPVDSNLSSVLDSVDQSVKDLLNTIPTLNDKISEVENLTSQVSPISNISENIKKIKDLIEQARDAANRVRSHSFTGSGHVELRPPKNLDDLKAYTSLSLSLQRPKGRGDGRRRRRQVADTGDMFVLYLGNRDSSKNYIGMVLRNNILPRKNCEECGSCKYKNVDFFSPFLLFRIYQDAEIVFTKEITSVPPKLTSRYNKQGMEDKDLLDLSPSDIVFYVGGYPSNFTPPNSMKYPNYKGCIEFSSFNDKVISLYNFQKAEKVNLETPCKRYVPPEDSYYYEGTGYGKVLIDNTPTVRLISMSIKTRSENGLLLYIGNEVSYCSYGYCITIPFFFSIFQAKEINLELAGGHVMLILDNKVWKSNKQYNDGQWHYLTATRKAGRYEEGSDLVIHSTIKKYKLWQIFSLCLNIWLIYRFASAKCAGLSLPEPQHTQTLKMVLLFVFPRPHFSVDVRTRSPEGLLFFAATRGGRSHLALYMSKGRIRLSVGKQKEIFNREKYNDGKWHSVIFSLEKKKFRLVVDGIRAQDGQLTNTELMSMQQFMSPVYLGSALPKHSVSGCIRNFKMNGAPMLNPTTNHGAGPCFEGQAQKGAYFSGNGAYVIINDSFVVGSSFELLFNIRPRSPTGLLLHVGDSSRMQYGPMMGHYLSVYMLRGEVRLHHTASVHCCWISEFVWSEISTPKFLLHF